MMSFDRCLFSASIKSRLLERRLSLREAAQEVGVSPSTLSRMANNEYVPDIESFALLVKWLEADANIFLQTPIDRPKGRERWTWFYLCLQELEVPTDLIEAMMTIIRLIVKKQVER